MATKKKTSTPSSRTKKPATRAKSAGAAKKKTPAKRTAKGATKSSTQGSSRATATAKGAAGRKGRSSVREKKPKKGMKDLAGPEAPNENPEAHALARKIAQLVLDKKANDVVILDVRGMTSYADYFVVASGESERQVSAMADIVDEKVKHEDGRRPIGTEGTETGQWVLIDYGDVVAHLFFKDVRAFYDLEGLWADAPREALH